MLHKPSQILEKIIFNVCVYQLLLKLKINATSNYNYFDAEKVWNSVYFFLTQIKILLTLYCLQ